MTATPSETHEAALSDERLREIIDGCKGVTPGPWKRYERASAAETRVHSDKHEVCTIHWERNGLEETAHRDGEYLARLDPDTVRALATELLARRTQPSAGEVVAWPLRRANVPHGRSEARVVGFIISPGDEAYGQYGLSEPLAWLDRMCAATPPDQSKRVERLEAALKPFADFAEKAEQFVADRARDGGSPVMPSTDFRLADFRRARQALGDRS